MPEWFGGLLAETMRKIRAGRFTGSTANRPVTVGVATLLFGFLAVARILSSVGGDITIFIGFGEDFDAINSHVESLLGHDVFVRSGQGHDGKFFYLQGLDPLYLQPDEISELLDRPLYRGQRMLYPALSGAMGSTPARALPWAMVGVNLLALALGSWGTANLAVRYGANAWWGLAFTFNVGLLAEVVISGGGVLAFAAAVWAVVAIEDDRLGLAGGWLALSVLAREAMFVFVVGMAFYYIYRHRRLPIVMLFLPVAAPLAWAVYLRLRLGAEMRVADVHEIGPPFSGIAGAVPSWLNHPFDMAVGVLVILVCAAFAVRAVRSPSYLGWGCAGFVPLAILMTQEVWTRSFDITRAIAPVLTAFTMLAFATKVPSEPNARP